MNGAGVHFWKHRVLGIPRDNPLLWRAASCVKSELEPPASHFYSSLRPLATAQ